MGKFWLLVFIFTPNGDFVEKLEYGPLRDKVACVSLASQVTKTLVNTNKPASYYCVSDNHYMGRSVDPDIPLDF